MARIEIDPNYSSPTFSRATAGTDLFKKEDVQAVAAAMSTHDHTAGKGLPVAALAANVAVPTTTTINGNVSVTGVFGVTGTSSFTNTATFGGDIGIQGGFTPASILRNTSTYLNIYNDGGIQVLNQVGSASYLTVTSTATNSVVPLTSDASARMRIDLWVGPEAGPAAHLSPGGTVGTPLLDVSSQLRVAGDRIVLNPDVILQRAAAAQLQITSQVGINFGVQGVYALSLPNTTPSAGQGNVIASRFDVYSSARFKTAILPIEDALQIVRDDRVHGVRYQSTMGTEGEAAPSVGFIAEQWAEVEPSVVAVGLDGLPVSMSYPDVGAITFEALKLYAQDTDARLAAIEAKVGL